MVEIALCLAVIGFALVAIVGVLPLGMQVQQENREETIASQDAAYFLEAIRNGALGLDLLTNYVEEIHQIRSTGVGGVQTNVFVYPADFTRGAQIIGLLSTPVSATNSFMEAYVRPLSGAASENGRDSQVEVGFRYGLFVQVVPFLSFYTNDLAPEFTQTLRTNMHEVRLVLRYPLLPNHTYGSGKQVLRALVSGKLEPNTNGFGYLFESASFHPLP
jgi:hypothetical protein